MNVEKKSDRIGEENYNTQGLKMWIKEYRKANDIDIEFEDGYLVSSSKYHTFKSGNIRNKNFKKPQPKGIGLIDRTGEINYNSSGNKMEIIEYINAMNITVSFDNGEIVKSRYDDFKQGLIKLPSEKIENLNKHLGEVSYNLNNEKMTIIKYNNANNIIVKFDDGYITNTRYRHFKEGTIRNPYSQKIFDIGFIGNGAYISGNTKQYLCWRNMLRRCYDIEYKEKNSTYKNCITCEEWHNFQNFAKWFDNNYYEVEGEQMDLDKDILFKGNKIYSPETCIFAPSRINCLFTKNNSNRGKHPIGVSYNKRSGMYVSYCGIKDRKFLGYHNTPEDAFYLGYKPYKENYIKQVADQYKSQIPQKLYDAMYAYEVEITD